MSCLFKSIGLMIIHTLKLSTSGRHCQDKALVLTLDLFALCLISVYILSAANSGCCRANFTCLLATSCL